MQVSIEMRMGGVAQNSAASGSALRFAAGDVRITCNILSAHCVGLCVQSWKRGGSDEQQRGDEETGAGGP